MTALDVSPLLTDREWQEQWLLCSNAGPLSEAEYHFRRMRERFEAVLGTQPLEPGTRWPVGLWEAMTETAKLRLNWTPS